MTARFFVPAEGGTVVAEVAGEGGDVVGGVGEAQDVVADEGAGGGLAERAVVVGGRDDRELLYKKEIQVLSLYFLACYEVKWDGV